MSSFEPCQRNRLCLVLATGLLAAAGFATAAPSVELPAETGERQAAVELLGRLPLLFVPAQVSADGGLGYVVRGSGVTVWLSESGLTYRLHRASEDESQAVASSWVVALDLVGATPRPPVGEDLLPTRVSYFKGPKSAWRSGLPSYGSVRYREPWPGVDLVVGGRAGELKSTFVVRPGADAGVIRLAYSGASAVRLGPDGVLVVETPLGDIREQPPVAYQDVDGRRVEVAASFELEKGSEPGLQAYRFRVGGYDPARELVVDPVTLVYCGYIGGSGDEYGRGIAVDALGRAYVTGRTESTEATFPVTVGPDLSYNGGDADVFVAKVAATGTALDYCGYIGGAGDDEGSAVAVDAAGNAYVTGRTESTEATFPVTVGPDITYNGGSEDAFVAKVNADGTALVYCGYVGGVDVEWGYGIALDTEGNAYVTGLTHSSEATFPVTVGPDLSFNGGNGDAFVARVNATGNAVDYCGYIGGSGGDRGLDIDIDGESNAYVAGRTTSTEATFPVTVGPDLSYNGGSGDAFVAKVDATGNALDYCGYIGGLNSEYGIGIAVDDAGNAYVTGYTTSTESTFPVTIGPDLTFNGLMDAFVAKVDVDGSTLDYCGYVGGLVDDLGSDVDIDPLGNAYLSGNTDSTEASFPVTVGPDLTFNGVNDAFVARVRPDGSFLDYCGYIGGSDWDYGVAIAVDAVGNAYLIGDTNSSEASFPVTVGPDLTYNGSGPYAGDAFVAKVSSFDLLADGFESGDTSAWSATVP